MQGNKKPVVNIHEAKTNLSRLVANLPVSGGFVIAKAGVPVATVGPFTGEGERPLGFDRGLVHVPNDFNDPLPADLLAGFYGEDA
jgi:antitoxin (DNA-binding transcriptional repressor) of toxin-antitoxin stability system